MQRVFKANQSAYMYLAEMTIQRSESDKAFPNKIVRHIRNKPPGVIYYYLESLFNKL